MVVISCPSCQSKFRVRPESDQGANFVKCAACEHVFVVTTEKLALAQPVPGDETAERLPDLSFIDRPDATSEPGEFTALGTGTSVLTDDEGPKTGKQAVLWVATESDAVPLTKFQTTIGRRNSDVTLDDPDVSRQHAVIERYEEKYLLKDLESTNGTYLNGQRVSIEFVKDGDVIRVGKTELRFQLR